MLAGREHRLPCRLDALEGVEEPTVHILVEKLRRIASAERCRIESPLLIWRGWVGEMALQAVERVDALRGEISMRYRI